MWAFFSWINTFTVTNMRLKQMSVLPQWARKPNHKKTVVATNRGWVVQETGEMLKLVVDLDQKLAKLEQESKNISKAVEVSKSVSIDQTVQGDITYNKDEKDVPHGSEGDQAITKEQVQKKKPGPKKKSNKKS